MKSTLSIGLFVFVALTANAFAQTASEKTQLAKQIKSDHDIGSSVREIASQMTVKKVDLNGDGKPEYIIWGIAEICGAGQCTHFIYRKAGAKLVNISGYGLDGTTYTVRKTRTNGYLDIAITEKEAFGGGRTVYRYNGSSYQ